MEIIILSILFLAGLGLLSGLGLGYASEKFKVEIDPRVEAVLKALPGSNCGACGKAGCMGLAEAIVKEEAETNACLAGGREVADAVCKALGQQAQKIRSPQTAVIKCGSGRAICVSKFDYIGEQTCKDAAAIAGGFLACSKGCLGYNDCIKVCPFDAMLPNPEKGKPPIIVREKCRACEKCIKECPRNVIVLEPQKREVTMLCATIDKGAQTRKDCKVGCIACQICVKKCPVQAISMSGRIPVVDEGKCTLCEDCIKACPTKTIVNFHSN